MLPKQSNQSFQQSTDNQSSIDRLISSIHISFPQIESNFISLFNDSINDDYAHSSQHLMDFFKIYHQLDTQQKFNLFQLFKPVLFERLSAEQISLCITQAKKDRIILDHLELIANHYVENFKTYYKEKAGAIFFFKPSSFLDTIKNKNILFQFQDIMAHAEISFNSTTQDVVEHLSTSKFRAC